MNQKNQGSFTRTCPKYVEGCGKNFTCNKECGEDNDSEIPGLCWCPECARKFYEHFSNLSLVDQEKQRKYYCKTRFGDNLG